MRHQRLWPSHHSLSGADSDLLDCRRILGAGLLPEKGNHRPSANPGPAGWLSLATGRGLGAAEAAGLPAVLCLRPGLPLGIFAADGAALECRRCRSSHGHLGSADRHGRLLVCLPQAHRPVPLCPGSCDSGALRCGDGYRPRFGLSRCPAGAAAAIAAVQPCPPQRSRAGLPADSVGGPARDSGAAGAAACRSARALCKSIRPAARRAVELVPKSSAYTNAARFPSGPIRGAGEPRRSGQPPGIHRSRAVRHCRNRRHAVSPGTGLRRVRRQALAVHPAPGGGFFLRRHRSWLRHRENPGHRTGAVPALLPRTGADLPGRAAGKLPAVYPVHLPPNRPGRRSGHLAGASGNRGGNNW